MKTALFLLLLLPFSLVSAQPPDTLWTRTYGGSYNDMAYSAQQTTDGGYILAGLTNSSVVGEEDFYIVKTNSQGEMSWTRTYGGGDSDAASSVRQTADGGYIVAGTSESFGARTYDFYLMKMNSQGDTIWTRTYEGRYEDHATCVRQTTDGGFIIAGYTTSLGAGVFDFCLLKTTSQGDSLWTRAYGGSHEDQAYSVQQTSDDGYVIAGSTHSFGAGYDDFYLVKTTGWGDTLWTRTYGGSGSDYATSVQQTLDGGYIVAGFTCSFGEGDYDFYLVKTDFQGNALWSRCYGGSDNDYAYSVQQTTDGGYIIGGYVEFLIGNLADIYLVKVDGQGDTLWTRTYGGNGSDYAKSIQQTSEGGYVIAGSTHVLGPGYFDFYLVKTEPDNSSGLTLYEIHIDQVTLNGSSSYAFNTGLVAGDYLDVSGHVTYVSDGQPVPDLVVGVTDEFSSICAQVLTNASGNFVYHVSVPEALSHFHHQVGFWRANAWPVYLAIPVQVNHEEHLLRSPQINFLLDPLNEGSPMQYGEIWSTDDQGTFIWVSPDVYVGGIKNIRSANDVNRSNYWEVLRLRSLSVTDPFLGHPEIYGRAEQIRSGCMAEYAESCVNRFEQIPGDFFSQHMASIGILAGSGLICASVGSGDLPGAVACPIFWGTLVELGTELVTQVGLTAAGVSEEVIHHVQTAEGIIFLIMNPRNPSRAADYLGNIAIFTGDEAGTIIDAQRKNAMAQAAYEAGQNGTMPFNNGSVISEWHHGGALDDIAYDGYVIQYDWADTTYVVGVMIRYDAAEVRDVPNIPVEFALSAFPNPFNPTTTISFSLPRSGPTRLSVFDILGREVKVLTDNILESGEHRVLFDGSDLPSGIYFARIHSGEFVATQKLLLLK